MMQTHRVAAVQMSSTDSVTDNLARVERLLGQATECGARLAVLPENFALMPRSSRHKTEIAETPGQGPLQDFLRASAKRYGLWIVAGSLPLKSPDPRRTYGASIVYDATGRRRDIYRKIHLFDVDLADSGESYRESNSMYPGDELVALDTPFGKLGLTICYDLRFPELYRALVDAGATLFTVPSAFTETTGRAHWEALLRARAVENLAYVIAAGQTGRHPDGRSTWGHSMVIDPWGRILAECESGEGLAVADIEPARVVELRREFPALSNRRLTESLRNRDNREIVGLRS